ncbi:N-acetylglucosamine-6-phosphate deacetylase [Acidiphilium sp.]|uniref:N-acetylglucosamine-6-phosphate deacetylase n=1 Tax=Acidiphilium sp. TaxID=527 RepID=UPI002585899E|nr:N-acetylglucosamine-6-phosphate deacetylase [Acidiphilium sp.]
MLIAADRLFRDGAITGPGAVAIENGRIAAVLDYDPANPDLRLQGGILAPGLIDLHNNGAFGIDCAEADTDGFRHLCRALGARGVTSFAPTVITAPFASLHGAARRLRVALAAMAGEPVARMPGLHLEGPFLAPNRHGAHRTDWLRDPTGAALDELLADPDLAATLKLVTLAPERPGGLAAVRRLTDAGVMVALGHSDADATEAQAAIEAGARLVTHVFTAMRPFHHRDPGLIGVALADARVHACFIADGVHADALALRFGFAATGARAVAVTDSVSLAGLPEGSTARFGGDSAQARDGAARRPDGSLTGATITLDEGLRRLIGAGIAPASALRAATEAPAAALGLADRGRLAAGCLADLVWFDDAFEIRNAWIGGTALHPLPAPARHAAAMPATETIRRDLDELDRADSATIMAALLDQEQEAAAAVKRAIPALARLAEDVAVRLEAGGRLFYAGAGTSGRLAVLDAVECGPTFSLPDGVIIPLIAGGGAAVTGAVEGAEDDVDAAAALLNDHKAGPADVLVGIAASGRTPFTLGALRAAAARGLLTGAIVNADGPLATSADIAVVIATGAEVLAGSTRLSAGTSQKLALNALSTTVMMRLGKTFGPYMVDLRATNAKLRARAIRIVRAIAGAPEADAKDALETSGYEVKTAIVMLMLRIGTTEARARLAEAGGRLRTALDGA